MNEFLLFIEEHQTWLYFLIAFIGLVYLRSAYLSYRELRRAIFGLERERAASRLVRAGAMLALVVAGWIAVFVIATITSPALPLSVRQTPIPTVALLATPDTPEGAPDLGSNTATPIQAPEIDHSGCLNESATIISPKDGDTVQGTVRILGKANIPNFAFYMVEYRRLDGDWLTVSAGSDAICETCEETEELGTWDTSLVEPGFYGFRLVVSDTAGNAPLPCEIQIRIVPSS
jgi:hypothetical protein